MKDYKMLHLSMRKWIFILATAVEFITSNPARAQTSPAQERLERDIRTLVGFGTRHTNSTEDNPIRGIGAARRWAQSAMERISSDSGGRFIIRQIGHAVEPIDRPRVLKDQIFNIVAVLPGNYSGPGRAPAVVLGAHLDSMVNDRLDIVSDAPGADDDGSGVAVVLETMRRLTQAQQNTTLIFALFTGEEQGLVGSKYLAAQLRNEYDVKAMLNLDIVGSRTGRLDTVPGISDQIDLANTVRCYSAGPTNSSSRQWAERLASELRSVPNTVIELYPQDDRPGRGGDHLSFSAAGIPAARFIQKFENMAHQHQSVRTIGAIAYGDTIDHLDYSYMEAIVNLTTAAMQIPQP